MNVIAKPPGQSPARIEKRANDERAYSIDCAPLLALHEMLVCVVSIDATPGLELGTVRTREGRYVEARIGACAVPAPEPHRDFNLRITLKTTQGTFEVGASVRVHAA